MPASKSINNQKSNRLVTQRAPERAGDIIVDWWYGAFLSKSDDDSQRYCMEAAQTLPLLIGAPATADILDVLKVHRIRLAKDQGETSGLGTNPQRNAMTIACNEHT